MGRSPRLHILVVAVIAALLATTAPGGPAPAPARAADPQSGWIVDRPSPIWCCGGSTAVHIDAEVQALLVDGPDPHLAVKLGTDAEIANRTGFVVRFYPPSGEALAIGTYAGVRSEDATAETPRIGFTPRTDDCTVEPGWFRIDELAASGATVTALAITSSCDIHEMPNTVQIRLGSAVPFAPAVREPAATTFPRTPAQTASEPRSLEFRAAGTTALHVSSTALGGADAADFEILADACTGATLAPGEACAVSVRFLPAVAGSLDRRAWVEIHEDSLPGTHRGTLSGPVELATTVTVTSSANPNPNPTRTDFIATVTPDPGYTGRVEWSIDGEVVGATWIGSAYVVSSRVGTYAVTARFTGITGYAPSPPSPPVQQVTLATTSVAIVPSPAASGLAGAIDVRATVTVRQPDVSGTVTITDLTTGHALGSGPVTTAALSLVIPDVPISGTHQLRADYGGVPPFVPPATTTITVEGTVGSDPAAAARVLVTGLPSVALQGVTGSATLTVLDARGRIVTGYLGTLHLTSTDVMAILPADVTFTEADAGRRVVPLTLGTIGTQSVTARDTADARIVGTGSVAVARPVTEPIPAASVARGAQHACAITADGTVRCWGRNADGQVGDGTEIDRLSPVVVPGVTSAVALAAGGDHTCALLADHTVRCWGANDAGQLGDGTLVARVGPVAVSGIDTAVAIEATGSGTCARLADGTVHCWGSGFAPSSGVPVPTATALPGVVGAISFGGGTAACYVDGSHAVWCWGRNANGQLGNGTTSDSATPVRVSGIATAVEVETGAGHACARLQDGTLRCWGLGGSGQLGDGGFSDRTVPVPVEGIADAVDLLGSPLADATCARLADGSVRCWGGNDAGQLGVGTAGDQGAPMATVLDGAAIEVSLGQWGGCAILTDGDLRCWGSNGYGELGDGKPFRLAPTPTVPQPDGAAMALPGNATCVLGRDALVRCWGTRVAGELGNGIGAGAARPVTVDLTDVAQVSGSTNHACARQTDGTVWCWGNGTQGQLGNGSRDVTGSLPVQATGVSTAIDVAAGGGGTCAVLADGTVWCWGSISGQIPIVTVPTQVAGITGATRVVGGNWFSCALLSDQTVTCWGNNFHGQLGSREVSDSPVPIAVPNLDGVTDLTALLDGVCALRIDHTVVCWGSGAPGFTEPGPGPGRTPVAGITTAVAIGSGYYHACAVLASGQVMCWGANASGQLGDGTIKQRLTPVAVPGITAVAIEGGHTHTCAITAAGAVECWGSDRLGQLGLGTRPFAPIAMPVDLRGIAPLAIALEAPPAVNTLLVPVSVTVRAGSPDARQYWVSNSSAEPPTHYSWSVTPASTRPVYASCGTCTIYAWARNDTGEVSAVATTTVIVDAIRPTASLTAPVATTAQTVPVTAGGADGQSGIGAWLIAETPVNPAPNDTRWRETAPTTFTLSSGDGLKRVFLWTRDLAWNVSPADEADVRLDRSAPTGLGAPGRGIAWSGPAKSTVPTRVAWTAARDLAPGGPTYAVAWQASGSSTWHAAALADPRSTATVLSLLPGTYRIRVRASDALGHVTSWRTGGWFTIRRLQESASSIRLVRGFTRVTVTGASGGRMATATRAGSTVTASFTGASVAWVGVRGPDRGLARVYLDGRLVATVNLYAATRSDAVVVWRRSFSSSRTHVLRIVATGTHAAGSTGTRVDLDAVVVTR